ncbi:MAG: hypothetical protein JOZ69_08230 [Myxococcales bacterium]|nr:hypothetical protein [Myxococcales bacterium]
MNRLLRVLVGSASVIGAIAASPAIASAQTVNVAPPAYTYAYPTPAPAPVYAPVPAVAPVPVPVVTPVPEPFAYPSAPRVLPVRYGEDAWRRAQWQREEARRERLRREHQRECARAYERGASPRVLGAMRCF